MRRLLPCALALSALIPAAAFAAVAGRSLDGAIEAGSIVTSARPDPANAAWQSFESRHGDWDATWNVATGSPHRAFGPSIALAGFGDDAVSAEQAVRGFIAAEPGLFGAPDLEKVATTRVNDRWYVRFRQVVDGLPVLFADWEFRVGANGRLSAFGADALRAPVIEDAAAPRIAAAVARAAATQGIAFDAARDQALGGETMWALPVRTESGIVLRRVLEVRVNVETMPPARWVALVDAVTGDVLMRLNRVRHAVTGQVTGGIHPADPFDALSTQPFKSQTITVGATNTTTDAAGNYSVNVSGTLTARLQGPWANVNRQDAADAVFTVGVTDPQVQNIAWGGHDAERDGFYHTVRTHDYIKALDPLFTGVDYAMPVSVNGSNLTCNAFWDGTGINFFLAAGGCPNTATMPSVVYHEYGHGINEWMYLDNGAPFGMTNGALHEGLADVQSNMMEDSPLIGRGFFGPGSHLRNADNTNFWPQDDGEGHFAGLLIAGSFWDLREAAGLSTAERLAHFAKYGIPDDADNGVAIHEYFLETLIADDDDANLANGTPNFAAIVAAFNAHGVGTGFFMNITHTPLADTPDHGPFAITANVTYTGPFGALDPGLTRLVYQVNGGPWQTVPMSPISPPGTFRANLPGVFVGLVNYYITSGDVLGGAWAYPDRAPVGGVVSFLAGPVSPVFTQTMETDPGWTVGGAGDNATTGIWIRANPVAAEVSEGVLSQPEDDQTPGAGVLCWITGNATAGALAGTNDVDGGQTTVTSNVFSALGVTTPLVEFYHWYSNNLGGAPSSDTFHVEISNDGGASWVTLDDIEESTQQWTRSVYLVEDAVTPTANMRLRFRAADFGAGSLVEAGVDDVRLLGVSGSVDVPAAGAALDFRVSAAPNPFAGSAAIRWALPSASDVSLSVYDAAGRRVRDLLRGRLDAGPHSMTWDGRDDRGRALGAGIYWLRLQAGGREVKASVTRLH